MKRIDVPEAAIDAAYEALKEFHIERTHLAVVWSAKVLQNWKAIVAVLMPNGQLLEITHNGDQCETYVDVYVKAFQKVVHDTEEVATDAI